MGIKTVYTCERCGIAHTEEQNATPRRAPQFWEVGISYSMVFPGMTLATVRNAQMWCRECCDAFQIITNPQKTTKDPEPKIITTGEKLVQVLEELGFQRS